MVKTQKIQLTDSGGKSIEFSRASIQKALERGIPEYHGESHVWACYPTLIYVGRERESKRGPYSYIVYELEFRKGKMIEIFQRQYDEIDNAIEMFVYLCKNTRKEARKCYVGTLVVGSKDIICTITGMGEVYKPTTNK